MVTGAQTLGNFRRNILSSQLCVSAELFTCLRRLYKVECQKCLGLDRLKFSGRKVGGFSVSPAVLI